MRKLPCTPRPLERRKATRPHASAAAAALVAAGLLWTSPTEAAPIPVDGDPVLFWAEVLSNSLNPAQVCRRRSRRRSPRGPFRW